MPGFLRISSIYVVFLRMVLYVKEEVFIVILFTFPSDKSRMRDIGPLEARKPFTFPMIKKIFNGTGVKAKYLLVKKMDEPV